MEGAGTPSPSSEDAFSSVHVGLQKGLNLVDALYLLDSVCLCLKYEIRLKSWNLAEDIWVSFTLICSTNKKKKNHVFFACFDIYVSVNKGNQEMCVLASKI